jgi:hypothetical protein
MNYTALCTVAPKPEQGAVLAAAQHLVATSPALVQKVKTLLPPGRQVALWRPALSRPIWQDVKRGAGLNTMPRVLWIDEGIAPAWLPEMLNEMAAKITWIVVERAEGQYAGSIARLRTPADETSWARELSVLAPHVLFRPVEAKVETDCYMALLAAAAGSHLLVDQRLDIPESLGPTRVPNSFAAWRAALLHAVTDGLAATLARGEASRAAALALPSIEDLPPPWLDVSSETRVGQAAE